MAGKTTSAQRSLKYLRSTGMVAAVVERWNAHAGIRQDLFGCADVFGFNAVETVLVQCTGGAGDPSKHLRKILANEKIVMIVQDWITGRDRSFEIHAWRKTGAAGKRKLWTMRRLVLLHGALDGPPLLWAEVEP